MEDAFTTVDIDTCKKVKAISPTIVVGGKLEKPYYSIIYYDVSDNNWHQGYGSYNLEYVREWLSNCFEVIDKPVRPVKYGTWNDDTCSECGSKAIDGYTSNYCPDCGAYMSSNTEKL